MTTKAAAATSPFARFAEETKTDETEIPVELVSRTGKPYLLADGTTRLTWWVKGEYSAQYKQNARAVTNSIIKKAQLGDEEFDADESDQITADKVAGAVTRWNLEDADGQPVPFTKANVIACLLEAPWFVPQVQKKVQGHARFFGPSSGA